MVSSRRRLDLIACLTICRPLFCCHSLQGCSQFTSLKMQLHLHSAVSIRSITIYCRVILSKNCLFFPPLDASRRVTRGRLLGLCEFFSDALAINLWLYNSLNYLNLIVALNT